MYLKSHHKFFSVAVVLTYLFNFLPVSYAFQATVLSDQELDDVCAGGFDFNLNAAFAFRAAVVNQANIAALSNYGANRLSITNSNDALVRNQGDSALANQLNISTIYAALGNITNATIKNLNTADVGNIFSELVNSDPGPSVEPTTSTSLSLSDTLPAPDATTTSDPSNVATPSVVSNDVITPMKLNDVVVSASAATAQTNIAAILAPNGNIANSAITNLNVANVANQGSAALAAQTNIAIIMAGGVAENNEVLNSNISNVVNTHTTDVGKASVTPITFEQVIGKSEFNQAMVKVESLGSQMNITFIKSLSKNIKDSIAKDLTKNKFINNF